MATTSTVNNFDAAILSPIGDLIGTTRHLQNDNRCRDFEFQLADCIVAYGFYKAKRDCLPMFNDLLECMYSAKQISRSEIMHAEYVRQARNGEREYQRSPFLGFF